MSPADVANGNIQRITDLERRMGNGEEGAHRRDEAIGLLQQELAAQRERLAAVGEDTRETRSAVESLKSSIWKAVGLGIAACSVVVSAIGVVVVVVGG